MKKIIILILMMNLFNSCNISIFGKLNHFGLSEALISSHINLNELSDIANERTLDASEYNDFADLSTTIVVDLDSISTSLISGGSSSFPDDWGFLPSPEEQSGLPIYSVLHLLGILTYQDLIYIGNDSFSGTFEGVNYSLNSSSTYVTSMSFSTGIANIHGWERDFFDTTMLDGGVGDLIRIDFSVSSSNNYIDGSGSMLISDGFPNGLLYLMYDHSTDYTSVVYQINGGGDSGGFFEAPYDGYYSWYTIRDGHELD